MIKKTDQQRIKEINQWIESRRAPMQESTWKEWLIDGAAMLFVAVCGFILIAFGFSL